MPAPSPPQKYAHTFMRELAVSPMRSHRPDARGCSLPPILSKTLNLRDELPAFKTMVKDLVGAMAMVGDGKHGRKAERGGQRGAWVQLCGSSTSRDQSRDPSSAQLASLYRDRDDIYSRHLEGLSEFPFICQWHRNFGCERASRERPSAYLADPLPG